VLSAAARSEVASQLALAQYLGIDRTVMTYLLDDLEREGLIERRPDPSDRRARRVVATDKGTALLVTLEERLRGAEAHLLAPLEAGARAAFRSQLQLIAARVNTLEPVGTPCDLADQAEAGLPTPLTLT
jgi:DNA-binding MarR family transcriptional regulator